MIGLRRLDNLEHCIRRVIEDRVPGDIIETGVWRGGACIFARAALAALGDPERKVWVADSFRGLPPPDPARHPADAGDRHHTKSALGIGRAAVEENFRRYGLLDDRVRFLEGWFADTLPQAPIERLAVLRLDGDMYGSTMDALGTPVAGDDDCRRTRACDPSIRLHRTCWIGSSKRRHPISAG